MTRKKLSTAVEPPPDDDLLRMRDVADILHCSVAHCYNLANNGRIPSLRVGGMIRTPRSKLMVWIQNNSVEGDPIHA